MTRSDLNTSTPSSAFISTALALAAGFALLYLATPTRHYTFDAVAYAYQIDRFTHDGRPGWLFHAHHLLFNVAGWLVWASLQKLGAPVTTLEALQIFNAVMGGIGVGLFAWVLASTTRRPALAVAMALLLGVTHGYWTCATDGRVNLPGLVLIIGAFGAALHWQQSGSAAWALAAGALTAAAILLHQSHVLFVPVLVLAMLLSRVPWRRRLAAGWAAALGLALPVATAYLAVAVSVKGIRDLPGLEAWLWQYGADGRWWSFDWRANLPLSAVALLRAAWPVPGTVEGLSLPFGVMPRSAPALAALSIPLLLAGGSLFVAAAPALLRRHAAALLLCFTWFATYAAFFTVWNPGYFPFWLPPLTAAGFGVGFIVAGLLPDSRAASGAWAGTPCLQGTNPGFAALARRGGRRQALGIASTERHAHLLRCLARRRAARRPASRHRSGLVLSQRRSLTAPSWERGHPARKPKRAGCPRSQERPSALTRWFSSPTRERLTAGLGRVAAVAAPAVLALGLLPVLFTHTYRLAIRPRMEAETNPYLRIAATLERTTRPGDLIVATGAGWLAEGEVYIPYFSERPLLALQQVFKRHGGDREVSLDYLRRYMERCWKRGGQVYVLQEVLSSAPAYALLHERYGLSQEEGRRFFQAYAPRPAVHAGPHSVWVLSNPAGQRPQSAAAGRGPGRIEVMGV